MGRDAGPKCKRCRREGEKLFLKGERCYTRSCAMSRRKGPPGEGSKKRRPRRSQYLLHLRAKQKVRRIYGLGERQFRNYVDQAKRRKGVTGEGLLRLLERRLDNIVYRGGLASSRSQARQMITHGHFEMNGRGINVPSALVREGDRVAVKANRRDKVKGIVEANQDRDIPNWMERNAEGMLVQVIAPPDVEQLGQTIETNLIVEFYSR